MKFCFLFPRVDFRRSRRLLHAAKVWVFIVVPFATLPAYAEPGRTDLALVENQAKKTFDYLGFHVQLLGIGSQQDASSLEGMVRQQIDIVQKSGLPSKTLAFFRRFPILANADRSAGLGHYSGGESVSIAALAHPDDRPILLHEYMHLFHHRIMPLGEKNPDIISYYIRAKEAHVYPEGSYVLSNPKEYFAMTASLFLNGQIARPPFTRENLRDKQPAYYEFLEHVLLHE